MASVNLNIELRSHIVKNMEKTFTLPEFSYAPIEEQWAQDRHSNISTQRFIEDNKDNCEDLLSTLGYTAKQLDTDLTGKPLAFEFKLVDLPDHLINFDIEGIAEHSYQLNMINNALRWNSGVELFHINQKYPADGESYKQAVSITNFESIWPEKFKPAHSPNVTSEDRSRYTHSGVDLTIWYLPFEQLPTQVQDHIELWAKASKIALKRDKATRQIRNILDECRTVGQFLSVFPEGQHLLPTEVIQRLHEKTPKKAKRKVDLTDLGIEDLGHIKQSILLNKIGAS